MWTAVASIPPRATSPVTTHEGGTRMFAVALADVATGGT
jgi:hypothetical protein